MLTETSAFDLLGREGPLADAIEGFAPRRAQQEMAQSIESALSAGESLICEAGTGTGKTFAYLVALLQSGGRAIVSTGTRNLQDQLYHRDLPRVHDVLGASGRMTLLKGRSNYLCLHRLELAGADGRFRARGDARAVGAVRDWSGVTTIGDIAELDAVPEDSPVWSQVTSTADNCLGQDCPVFRDCFLVKARRRAQEADLVVVNHHLLCADLALKDGGFGELLPEADTVVIDEAHQLPEIASLFFGQSVTGRQLMDLARDATAELLKSSAESREPVDTADQLRRCVQELRLAFGREPRRAPWGAVMHSAHVGRALDSVGQRLDELRDQLECVAERSKGLQGCARRCVDLGASLAAMRDSADEDTVRWFETFTRSFVFHRTPLDISPLFRQRMEEQGGAWVFTSATLAVSGNLDHFRGQLGLDEVRGECWASPFDFEQQSCLYLPAGLPDPGDAQYTDGVIRVARPLLQASRGRAFLLFTSHRALRLAAQALSGTIDFPVLVQGEAPRSQLLERFRELGNAVLLGTGSFWEGVDVRGEALSLVLIDKLPFAVPDDPVLKARMDASRRQGKNPFMAFQVPAAVIALKQGVGRLIRDVSDRGVLVLCDPRLRTRSYGRVFIDSLPAMPVTESLSEVQAFFNESDCD